jgi:hypothetical protein
MEALMRCSAPAILVLRNAPLDRETAPVEGIGVHQNERITLADTS